MQATCTSNCYEDSNPFIPVLQAQDTRGHQPTQRSSRQRTLHHSQLHSSIRPADKSCGAQHSKRGCEAGISGAHAPCAVLSISEHARHLALLIMRPVGARISCSMLFSFGVSELQSHD